MKKKYSAKTRNTNAEKRRVVCLLVGYIRLCGELRDAVVPGKNAYVLNMEGREQLRAQISILSFVVREIERDSHRGKP